MKQLIYCLFFIVVTGCTLENWSFTNTGSVGAGDNIGNQSDIDIHQDSGDRILSKEEVDRAKQGYERGKNELLETQASLGLIDGAFNIEWESDISRREYLAKNPKLDTAHRDLITILHLVFKRAPDFRLFQVARSLDQQRKNMDRGVTTTITGSRHTWSPTQAADIRSTRKAKPFVNGKTDIYDVEFLGYVQGLSEAFGMTLSNYPCEAFASTVRRVMRWKTIRDLFHIETNARPECKEGYKTKFNKFALFIRHRMRISKTYYFNPYRFPLNWEFIFRRDILRRS